MQRHHRQVQGRRQRRPIADLSCHRTDGHGDRVRRPIIELQALQGMALTGLNMRP